MTVGELIDVLLPLLTVALLVVGIIFAVQLVLIALRVKKILERVETISDVSGWLNLIKKWPGRKKSQS